MKFINGEIKDWKNGDTEPVSGKTFPSVDIVERDYTKIYDKLVSLGPLVSKHGCFLFVQLLTP